MTASQRDPRACFICSQPEHPPTAEHTFWPREEAQRFFDAEPGGGALPSMTVVETLDPREAVI